MDSIAFTTSLYWLSSWIIDEGSTINHIDKNVFHSFGYSFGDLSKQLDMLKQHSLNDDEHDIVTMSPEVQSLVCSGIFYAAICEELFGHEACQSLIELHVDTGMVDSGTPHLIVLAILAHHGHLPMQDELHGSGSTMETSKDYHGMAEVLSINGQGFDILCHLKLMDALIAACTKTIVSIKDIVASVRRIGPYSVSNEQPFDLEDALLLWLNKGADHVMEASHFLNNDGDDIQFMPADDLLKSMSDCQNLALVLAGHNVLDINSVKLLRSRPRDPLLFRDEAIHNIKLVKTACERLDLAFPFNSEDLFYTNASLRYSVIAQIATIFRKVSERPWLGDPLFHESRSGIVRTSWNITPALLERHDSVPRYTSAWTASVASVALETENNSKLSSSLDVVSATKTSQKIHSDTECNSITSKSNTKQDTTSIRNRLRNVREDIILKERDSLIQYSSLIGNVLLEFSPTVSDHSCIRSMDSNVDIGGDENELNEELPQTSGDIFNLKSNEQSSIGFFVETDSCTETSDKQTSLSEVVPNRHEHFLAAKRRDEANEHHRSNQLREREKEKTRGLRKLAQAQKDKKKDTKSRVRPMWEINSVIANSDIEEGCEVDHDKTIARINASATTPVQIYDTGPSVPLFREPEGKSNRKLLRNAVQHACLPGGVNKAAREQVLEEMELSDFTHFLILFRDERAFKFRALYAFDPEIIQAAKLYGVGPTVIYQKMIAALFKYNTGSKAFTRISAKTMSTSSDAICIHNSYWLKRKPSVKN